MKLLKNILLFILVFAFCLSACGCTAKAGPIAEHEWRFSAVQNRKDGNILYASAEEQQTYGGVYAEAETLELSCEVSGKAITLKRQSDGQEWSFKYTLESEAEGTYYYTVQSNQSSAATVSASNFSDGTTLHTLLVMFEEYTLYFYHEQ